MSATYRNLSYVLACGFMAAPVVTHAAVVVDQEYYVREVPPGNFFSVVRIGTVPGASSQGGGGINLQGVQTFTAGTAGFLNSLLFQFYNLNQSFGPITFSLIDGNYLNGATSIVGEATYDIGAFGPPSAALNLSFETRGFGYQVSEGSQYSVLFAAPLTDLNNYGVFLTGTARSIPGSPTPALTGTAYDGGEFRYIVNGTTRPTATSSDVGFVSFVDTGGVGAVPEPSTWVMLLFGFFGVGASLRRKRVVSNSSESSTAPRKLTHAAP